MRELKKKTVNQCKCICGNALHYNTYNICFDHLGTQTRRISTCDIAIQCNLLVNCECSPNTSFVDDAYEMTQDIKPSDLNQTSESEVGESDILFFASACCAYHDTLPALILHDLRYPLWRNLLAKTADENGFGHLQKYFLLKAEQEQVDDVEGGTRSLPFSMGKCCVVANCSNTSKDGVSLHRFPTNSKLRREWNRQVERTRTR